MAFFCRFVSFFARKAVLRHAMITLSLLSLAAPGSVKGDWDLVIEPVVTGTGTPTTARLSVTGADSLFHHPLPDSTCLFYNPMGGYFYVDASDTVAVPAGPTRIRASKGYEFEPVDITVDVQSDTTVTIELTRWIDMRASGWVGGEGHAHLIHPPVDHILDEAKAKMAATAEGLHIVNYLDNGFNFTGSISSLSDTSVVVFPSEEYRSAVHGHLGLLGIDTLIAPDWSNDGWPVSGSISAEVRGHTHALAVFAHPTTTDDFYDQEDWPGTGLARGIWIDAALEKLDAFDVLSYSSGAVPGGAALTQWYHLWNCGFAIPGSAGSDASLSGFGARPPGGMRVYVEVPTPYAPPQSLYDAWVNGIRRGRTFVTSGPMISSFNVDGAGAGETLFVADGMPLDVNVSGTFESARNLKFVELVVNGIVVDTFDGTFRKSLEISTIVPVRETSWIALRHYAYDFGHFMPNDWAIAHPTPVLVQLNGDALTSGESGEAAIQYLDMLDTLLASVSYPGTMESLSVKADLDSAREVWLDRADSPPGSFNIASPPGGVYIEDETPTLRWHPSVDPDAGDIVEYRLLVASDAEFADLVQEVNSLTDTFWTFPDSLTIGERYWWRVQAQDPHGAKRWAEEIVAWFEIATATNTGAGHSDMTFNFSAAPNPSRGEVIIGGVIPSPRGGSLTIYNIAGQEIRSFSLIAGANEIVWDGRDRTGRRLAGGIYFYRIRSTGMDLTKKAILLR